MMATPVHRKEWPVTAVVRFISSAVRYVSKGVVNNIAKTYANDGVQTEARRGSMIGLTNNAINKALHAAIYNRHVISAFHYMNGGAAGRAQRHGAIRERWAGNRNRPTAHVNIYM